MSTSAKDRLAAILAARRAKNGESSGGTAPKGVFTNTPASAGVSGEPASTNQDNPAEQAADNKQAELSETVSKQPPAKKVTRVMAPGNEAHPLALKLWELEEAMDKKLPDRALILKHIHDSLKADPAVVTLLTDEAIGIIVAGLTEHTNTTITAAPKKVTGKRSQPLSLDLLD